MGSKGDVGCHGGDGSNPYHRLPVAVIGATGFVGRWVARELSRRGSDLFLFVRSATAAASVVAEYGIRGELVEADLLQAPDCLVGPFQRIRPAITFNLSGYGVRPDERDERLADRVNSRFPPALCDAVGSVEPRDWAGQALVHAGSALEYGEVGGDLDEESRACPTTAYGSTKLSGTRRLAARCREKRIRGITARLFTVYGPGEAPQRLLPSLIRAAALGGPVALTEGRQRRDFTYVQDVADGMLRLGLSASGSVPIVNLASGRLTSVREFALVAARCLSIPDDRLRFGVVPSRPEEMNHRQVTTARLRRLTEWIPSTDIESGIRETVRFDEAKATVHKVSCK